MLESLLSTLDICELIETRMLQLTATLSPNELHNKLNRPQNKHGENEKRYCSTV